jgi:hypothetical protein
MILSFEEFSERILCAEELATTIYQYDAKKSIPYRPDFDDLYFLYTTIRKDCVISILEFGSGWSTLAMSLALLENKQLLGNAYTCKNPNPFQLMTIDADQYWMTVALQRLSSEMKQLVVPIVSKPRIVSIQGAMVSIFPETSFFVPDLVYLDGPDIDQVEGDVNNFYLDQKFGLPMAGDLILLESYLLPWTTIVTDGRKANATLLEGMFRRNWQTISDPFGDRTTLRLDENPLGRHNEKHIQFRLEHSRLLRQK